MFRVSIFFLFFFSLSFAREREQCYQRVCLTADLGARTEGTEKTAWCVRIAWNEAGFVTVAAVGTEFRLSAWEERGAQAAVAPDGPTWTRSVPWPHSPSIWQRAGALAAVSVAGLALQLLVVKQLVGDGVTCMLLLLPDACEALALCQS